MHHWISPIIQACARLPEILQNFGERRILWSLCSVVFRPLTLKVPTKTSLHVVPKIQVYVRAGEKCENFSKTSTPQRVRTFVLLSI